MALFTPLGQDLSDKAIDRWWWQRRFFYNVLVLVTWFISVFIGLFCAATSGRLAPGEDFAEPMGLVLFLFVGPICWNLCYSLGAWMQKSIPSANESMRRAQGPYLMKLGVGFSIFILSLPGLSGFSMWFSEITSPKRTRPLHTFFEPMEQYYHDKKNNL